MVASLSTAVVATNCNQKLHCNYPAVSSPMLPGVMAGVSSNVAFGPVVLSLAHHNRRAATSTQQSYGHFSSVPTGIVQATHCRDSASQFLPHRAVAPCAASGGEDVHTQAVADVARGQAELAGCADMDEVCKKLAQELLEKAGRLGKGQRYLVALAGPPGAGKSTVANEVVTRVNQAHLKRGLKGSCNGGRGGEDEQGAPLAVALPMDGFHLYKRQLDAMENPKEAHARRGAPWTFDSKALRNRIKQLRTEGSCSFPSFDHGVGDPEEDMIVIPEGVRIIVLEGNYLLLPGPESIWTPVHDLFNEKWYLHVEINEAMQRVENRHVSTGKPPSVATWRVTYNDRPNAQLIETTKGLADLLIESISWS